jgi:hypothetical protein
MTRPGQEPETPSHVEEGDRPQRRPYRSPTLRRLGSVRELTLGGSKGKTETIGFKNTTGM